MNLSGGLASTTIVAMLSMLTSPTQAGPRYVGATKCKMCHNRKDQANQFEIWSNSAHAKAYASLGTDSAKTLAAKAGLQGDPQKAPQCLECHVTGYGKDTSHYAESYALEEGVQCEACHGAGSNYKATSIMSAPKYTADRAAQHKLALEAGLQVPDEKTCRTCHNERSPAFSGFVFKDYYDRIKHPYTH